MFYWQDVRYALRLLARHPAFTLLTVVVLAGGLGLSIFTFSFLHTAMLKPLPVADGDRIVRVMTLPGPQGTVDAVDLAAIRADITTLTDVGAYSGREVIAGTGERAATIDATESEWNVFEVTRTRPILGRGFRADDQAHGAEPVIVLGYRTWRVTFGADSSLVGRLVLLNGVSTRVIGVMPDGYGFPVASEAWMPMRPAVLATTQQDQEILGVYARLAPGVSASRAESELSGLLLRARQARPALESPRPTPTGMALQSFPAAQIGEGGPLVLAVLNTIAGLILLLACINVTNLLLARANERARETAVRLALGAPRGRLVMQSMWESIIICLAGGALATGIAAWGLDAVNGWAHAHLEDNLAFWWVWGFDRTVLLSAGVFVTIAISVLGGVIALRATRTEVHAVLQEGGSRDGGRREGRVARVLVIAQVATVSVLMFFGCMSAIIAHRVATVDLGYDTRNLLRGTAGPPRDRYKDAVARGLFFQQLRDQLAVQPTVDGVMLRVPLADMADPSGEIEVGPQTGGLRPRAYVMGALGPLTPLGIDLREGRFFDARDNEGGERTAIISAAMAARDFPGGSPLGRQIRLSGLDSTEIPRTVVGVVDDVLLGNPLSRERSLLAVYIPVRQSAAERVEVLFRHRGSEIAAQASLHQVLGGIDPLIPGEDVQSFDDVLAKMTLMAKSVAVLFAACFGFALLLAVSGTYGLMARSITRRTREIGVRRALGATDQMILSMLLGQGARQLGIGAVVALPLTMLTGFAFSRYFPVSAGLSVVTAVLVSAAITGVVLLATWLPTRRAVAIEPRDALWRE